MNRMHSKLPNTTASDADSILVVLDPDDPATTHRAILHDAVVTGGDLHLLVAFPTAEYEARRRARMAAGVPGPYTIDHLAMEGRRIAQRVGREWLGSDGPNFQVTGTVGKLHDCVRDAVREYGHTRVYVAALQRSLWQRLLGDTDMSPALARVLPDHVTVISINSVPSLATYEGNSDAAVDRATEPAAQSTDQ